MRGRRCWRLRWAGGRRMRVLLDRLHGRAYRNHGSEARHRGGGSFACDQGPTTPAEISVAVWFPKFCDYPCPLHSWKEGDQEEDVLFPSLPSALAFPRPDGFICHLLRAPACLSTPIPLPLPTPESKRISPHLPPPKRRTGGRKGLLSAVHAPTKLCESVRLPLWTALPPTPTAIDESSLR